MRIRTFEFYWELVQVCGRVHGCKHGKKTPKSKKQVFDDRCERISACTTRRTRRKASRGRLRGTGPTREGSATHAACGAPRQRQRQEAIVLPSSKIVELS